MPPIFSLGENIISYYIIMRFRPSLETSKDLKGDFFSDEISKNRESRFVFFPQAIYSGKKACSSDPIFFSTTKRKTNKKSAFFPLTKNTHRAIYALKQFKPIPLWPSSLLLNFFDLSNSERVKLLQGFVGSQMIKLFFANIHHKRR